MKIHFIGIGGIGVSALAKYYLKKRHQVSGSDLVSSEITETLKKLGVKIYIGKHKAKNLPRNVDFVIYSLAILPDNPELKEAIVRDRISNIAILSYPQALGELTKQYFTIAVSGTHGKSTTTAMIGLILVKAGLDPTVIVGTKLKEFGNSNCRVGKGKYLVIEADEWQASFLNYWPKIIVLTNIEKEHLDFYKNLNHILKTYKKYIGHLPKDGVLVANSDDFNTRKIIKDRISKGNPISLYWLNQRGTKKLKKILKILGEYNISNALAALTVARVLKITDKISFEAISKYKGAWRRFEIKKITINNKQLTIISDYAHHPTEIKATLQAVAEKYLYPPKSSKEKFRRAREIWCIFQPHQHQRTFYLFNDFVKVFRDALTKKFAWAHSRCHNPRDEDKLFACDKLIITDIYDVAGRENKKIKKKISARKLIKAINKPQAIYISTIKKAADYLKKNLQGGEVVIIMGAGDIYKLVEQF